MKLRILLLVAFSICYKAYCQLPQFGKNLIEGAATKSNIKKATGFLATKLSNSRKEYDEALFNYAVSLSDNAGLYESQQQYKKHEKLLLDVMKGTDNKANTPLENAADYLDAGEMFYSSNKFRSAENSFKAAILIYENQKDTTSDPFYARALSDLGLLYHTTGRYNLAENYTLQGLNLRKRIFTEN